MVDNSGDHEQAAFKDSMVDQVEDRRKACVVQCDFCSVFHMEASSRHAEQRHDQTKLGNSRECQNAFQVFLLQSEERTPKHGEQTDSRDQPNPSAGCGEYRGEAGNKIQTGFYHSCGVQVSTDWSRCLHGIRQPDIERELCRFRKGSKKNQHERPDEKVVANQFRRLRNQLTD